MSRSSAERNDEGIIMLSMEDVVAKDRLAVGAARLNLVRLVERLASTSSALSSLSICASASLPGSYSATREDCRRTIRQRAGRDASLGASSSQDLRDQSCREVVRTKCLFLNNNGTSKIKRRKRKKDSADQHNTARRQQQCTPVTRTLRIAYCIVLEFRL